MLLYTIGHSNHTPAKLIQLLEQNRVETVVDVRSAPYSRFNPQFNKDDLARELDSHRIGYHFAGQSLGGRPKDPSCYKNHVKSGEGADFLHEVDYPAVMEKEWFQKGIAGLLEIAGEQVTAILCSEEDPARCHRHHLISKYLLENHPEVDVRHIRGDGAVFGAGALRTSLDGPNAEQLTLF